MNRGNIDFSFHTMLLYSLIDTTQWKNEWTIKKLLVHVREYEPCRAKTDLNMQILIVDTPFEKKDNQLQLLLEPIWLSAYCN